MNSEQISQWPIVLVVAIGSRHDGYGADFVVVLVDDDADGCHILLMTMVVMFMVTAAAKQGEQWQSRATVVLSKGTMIVGCQS